jgi:hypothetical protein
LGLNQHTPQAYRHQTQQPHKIPLPKEKKIKIPKLDIVTFQLFDGQFNLSSDHQEWLQM